MKCKCGAWLSAVMLVLLTMATPGTARGEDLIVQHNPANGNFATIQEAIISATSRLVQTPNASFTIRVKADPVPYSGSFTPVSNVPIIGDSTAGTFLSGSGAVTLINLNNVTSVEIGNFTFQSASVGISVVNSSANIHNNVFLLGTSATAIQIQNSPSTSIVNNTFFENATAIRSDSPSASGITVINNIFSKNSTAISSPTAVTNISYNDYFANTTNGVAPLDAHSIPTPLVPGNNPLFVNPSLLNGDFHLQSGSPCIGSGNLQYINSYNTTSDMGAYGGPGSDILLGTVTGLTSSLATQATSATMTLNWSPTSNSSVTAYRVYYGTSSRGSSSSANSYNGTQASEGPSPLTVPKGTTTQILSGLPVTKPPAPAVPTLTGLAPLDQALQVTWKQVPDATGYLIYYSTASFDANSLPVNPVQVSGGAVTTAQIPNLINGTTYFVAVAAQAQTTFYAAVTAVIDSSIPSNPGSANESSFSLETSKPIPDAVTYGGISTLLSDFPETPAPFPNLKSEGCFIATAAYGFYSAPQVQALRDFRDRYLLTNAPGRAFVAWYYHYGPRGAHFINQHPWLKAPVRVALLPLIIAALVLTGGSPLAKTAVALLTISLLIAFRQRKKSRNTRRPELEKLLLTLLLIILPSLAQGAEVRPDLPHWSLELKGGAFFPATPDWNKFYDSSYTGQYGGALAYKVFRQVEVGMAGSYLNASGKGQLPLHSGSGSQVTSGDVSYELLPLDVYVLARAVFKEDQLLVPYAAAGYTRLFYREELSGQETVKGSVNGYHGRAGVQILLDGIEADASRNLYLDYGIHHTYLFLEAKYLHAKADTLPTGSVNLGGTSYLGGFLFEF